MSGVKDKPARIEAARASAWSASISCSLEYTCGKIGFEGDLSRLSWLLQTVSTAASLWSYKAAACRKSRFALLMPLPCCDWYNRRMQNLIYCFTEGKEKESS